MKLIILISFFFDQTITKMLEGFKTNLINWLSQMGVNDESAIIITDYSFFIILILISVISYFAGKKILLKIIHRLTLKSKTKWDDILAQNHFFKILSF